MREILFRGKREYDNEWMYGYLVKYNERCYIYYEKPDEMYQTGKLLTNDRVIPETVGQYTGLTDKNGNRIFEGDIIKAVHKSEYVGVPNTDFGIGVVEYEGTYYGSASYQINIIGEVGNRAFSASLEVEVIGNIHDNPEL